MAGATRRIARGAGHSYVLDGEPVRGVTTLIGEGCPKPGLPNAARTQTAAYAVTNWADLDATPIGKRASAIDKGAAAEWRKGSARGTAVHGYAAALLNGDEVDVPDEVADVVDAALAFLTDWHVVELHVEAPVFNRGSNAWGEKYAGTVDLLAHVGDDVWLFDWKTGASGIWPEVALQLCAYAHAETLLDERAGYEVPMPHVAHAAGVWLRSDGYDVHEVDISDATFRAFLYVKAVADWRARPREDFVSEALPAPYAAASA
jgi:hypothetical protein